MSDESREKSFGLIFLIVTKLSEKLTNSVYEKFHIVRFLNQRYL